MKTLILVRHAKSNHAMNGQRDIERSLNEKGMADATMMAQRLLLKGDMPDAFISSPAKRAFTTCSLFAKVFNLPAVPILTENKLYEASANTFYEVVQNVADQFSCIALFSHNPGISYFVNTLSSKQIEGMPTCGIFAVKTSIDSWKDFRDAQKDFCYFDFPKNLS
ncbi:MAG: histidine phosphatase family protein [Bacteroidetes bacterium]|nr:histidine phosphatase family protein [Bacteroidota bacterium]